MKKILLIIFILICGIVYADDGEDLLTQISRNIVFKQTWLKEKGYESEDLFWSSIDFCSPGGVTRYWLDLKSGNTYIFYTESNGPFLGVCCGIKFDGEEEIFCYERSGSSLTWKFIPRHTGKHYYLVRTLTEGEGIHVSYFTRIREVKK